MEDIEIYRSQLAKLRASVLAGQGAGCSKQEIVDLLTAKNIDARYVNLEKALRLLFTVLVDEL